MQNIRRTQKKIQFLKNKLSSLSTDKQVEQRVLNSVQMANKYRKNCSASLAINRTQVKTAPRLLFTLVRVATITQDDKWYLGRRTGINWHNHYSKDLSVEVAIHVLYHSCVYTQKF